MTRERLWEVLDRGADGADEVDFADAAWREGMGMLRRRRVLAVGGLAAAGTSAAALAVALGGGPGELTAPMPAVTPSQEESEDPTTADGATPTAVETTGDPVPQPSAQVELGAGTIGGVRLPAPAEEVIEVVEEHLGPQFVPPDASYYPDFGDPTGCEAVGLVPGPGEARFAHWEVDGTTFYVRGRVVEGTWTIDAYEVRADEGELLSLPFGLQIGMATAEALDRMPDAEERRDPLLPDEPAWFVQDDVHVFPDGPVTDPGAGGTSSAVSTVQFGPLHCVAQEEQLDLAAPGVVGSPAAEVLPELTRMFGEADVARSDSAAACDGRPLEQHSFGEVLRIDVTTDPAGTLVVDGWSVTGDDERIVLALEFWIGMSVDEARALAWTPDPGTEQPDGTLLLRMGRNELVFSDEPTGRTLLEVRSIPTICTASDEL